MMFNFHRLFVNSIVMVVGLCVLLPGKSRSQNIVVNGSFEMLNESTVEDTYTTAFGILPTNAVSGWQLGVSGGTAYDGVAAGTGALGDKVIANGTNAIFLQGTGFISQTLTLPAGAYTLSFYAMGRTNANGGDGANPINVSLGNIFSQTLTPANSDQASPASWILYSYNLSVPVSGSYLLEFAGTLPYGTQGDHASYVDDVQMTPGSATSASRGFVTVINPSFEDNQQAADVYTAPFGGLDPQTGIPGWQFNASGNDSYSGIVTEDGGTLGTPKYIPQGWQAAFIQGTGQFSQAVSFETNGTYVIRFRAAGRSNGGAGSESIIVSVDGNPVGTFQPQVAQWALFTSASFTVTNGTHVISFAGTVPYAQADRTSFIDAVQIVTPAEAQAVSPPTSPVYDVVFVGDSITAGATLANSATQSSATQCMQSLGQRFNAAIRMSNQGHSGHTTVDWLPSTNPSSDFAEAIAAATALETNQPGQLVFSIMLGANDSAQSGPNGSPVSPIEYRQNMQAIVGQFLTNFPNALVFIHDPTWYSTNTENSSVYLAAGLARLQSYFPEIDELISNCATLYPGHVFAGDKQAFAFFSTNYLTDLTPESGQQGTFYLHPNAAGAVVLGRFWANAIAGPLNLITNDSYTAWLECGDRTPGLAATGFTSVPPNAIASNGLSYGMASPLTISPGNSTAINVSAEVRSDNTLNVELQTSSDLVVWNPVMWPTDADQDNVVNGFVRHSLMDAIHLAPTFYRVEMNLQWGGEF